MEMMMMMNCGLKQKSGRDLEEIFSVDKPRESDQSFDF